MNFHLHSLRRLFFTPPDEDDSDDEQEENILPAIKNTSDTSEPYLSTDIPSNWNNRWH